MRYLQVMLEISREESASVMDILERLGAMSVSICGAGDEVILEGDFSEDPYWKNQSLVALFGPDPDRQPLEQQLSLALPHHEVAFFPLEDRDWERAWLGHFAPQRIADGFWVVPSSIPPPDPQAVNVVIDPGLAFGSGTHPTTQLCLKYLTEIPVVGKRVLDYGCGSGILSIAMVKLGASHAVATDIDPRALETCVANARQNACIEKLRAVAPEELETMKERHSYDIVVANILAAPLLALRDRLCKALSLHGMLLLSGILEDQADTVEDAYRGPFEWIRRYQSGWVLLAGQFAHATDSDGI